MADKTAAELAADAAAAAAATTAPATDAADTATTDAPAVVTPEAFALMQKALKKANKEAEDRRLELAKIADDQRIASEKALADAGKHVELAQQREGERDAAILEAKGLKAQIAEYEALLGADIEARVADWPDEVKALVSTEGDALARMRQVQSLEPLATKLAGAPAVGGARPGPVPGGKAPTMDELKQRKLESSSYPTF